MWDDIFGGNPFEDAGEKLKRAALIRNIRDMVNRHSADMKKIVEKLRDIETRLAKLERKTND